MFAALFMYNFIFRKAHVSDALRLSILFQQVYIHAYAVDGVTTEYANFISAHFSVERIRRTISSNPDAILVAANDEHLIGVAEIEYDRKCPLNGVVSPELSKLYVLDRFCGMGVGSRLIKEAEQLLRSKGHHTLWLCVWEPNIRAFRFYERHGYRWIGNACYQNFGVTFLLCSSASTSRSS